jgi:hypothetical protein
MKCEGNLIMKTFGEMGMVLASRKAARTTDMYIFDNGENPMGCGFAWVVVKGARGKKAELLKEFGFKKRYDGPGLSNWNPSGNMTQDMDAKYAGAQVYAEQLREMGIDATAYCRLD